MTVRRQHSPLHAGRHERRIAASSAAAGVKKWVVPVLITRLRGSLSEHVHWERTMVLLKATMFRSRERFPRKWSEPTSHASLEYQIVTRTVLRTHQSARRNRRQPPYSSERVDCWRYPVRDQPLQCYRISCSTRPGRLSGNTFAASTWECEPQALHALPQPDSVPQATTACSGWPAGCGLCSVRLASSAAV